MESGFSDAQEILPKFAQFKVRDPRDAVFALLSLTRDVPLQYLDDRNEGSEPILNIGISTPDYRRDVSEIF
jgi:hypothetical protein